jgi:signal transduction histidine kinase
MGAKISTKTNITEAILIAVITVSSYFIAAYFELAENWQEWAHPEEHYQLDELIFVFMTLSLCLIWFSHRRYKELKASLEHNIAISTSLEHKNTEVVTLLKQNRELIKHITQVRESERNELARELHDVFGQYLAAIDVNAAVACKYAENDEKLQPVLQTIHSSATHLIEVTRSQLQSIKQPNIQSMGLSASIESLLSQWLVSFPNYQLSSSIDVEDSWVSNEIGLSIYRCVQEGLSNIVKHAGANTILISVSTQINKVSPITKAKEIVLIIQDNGVGLSSNKRSDSGLGIIGMRERINALSGEFSAAAAKTSGTEIRIKVPL